MEELFKQWTTYLASGVEGIAGVLIAFAAIQATIRALLLFLRPSRALANPDEPKTEDIRLRLGRWLALALEFELERIFCVQQSLPRGTISHNSRPSLLYGRC